MPDLLKPTRIKHAYTIGIVSPSFGAAGLFPHRLERGVQTLKDFGYQVKVAPHAANVDGYVSDTAANRAADINGFFADPDVKAIIAAIGGDHSNQLLPLLDFDLIRQNPKVFMGYSDITVLNVALHTMTGLVTFNGPALLTDFAEYPQMYAYTEQYFKRAVAGVPPIGEVLPSPWWTEEFLDWEAKKDLERARAQNPSPGWTWLKPGRAEGRLLGGCLSSLNHLRGTPYWPDWQGKIFFWELSEEKPSPAAVDSLLMDYQNMGVFDQISAMLVGRPMSYSDDEKAQLRAVIKARTAAYDFPIIADMDFGHTAPQFTLPLGVLAQIDSETRCFRIVESAVV